MSKGRIVVLGFSGWARSTIRALGMCNGTFRRRSQVPLHCLLVLMIRSSKAASMYIIRDIQHSGIIWLARFEVRGAGGSSMINSSISS